MWVSCYVFLHAGLPVQVRDQALKIHDEIPKSDVGKEYYQQNLEREVGSYSTLTALKYIISTVDTGIPSGFVGRKVRVEKY